MPQKSEEKFEEEPEKIDMDNENQDRLKKQNQEKDNENVEVESKSFQVISSQKEITENEELNLQLDFGESNE